jgi:2-methylisocitrate lyase-like PEP mutase family enzyme
MSLPCGTAGGIVTQRSFAWKRRAPSRVLTVVASQREQGEAFRALHEAGTFVIPNPWDAGSARLLESLGFEALATTSSGFAFTLGRRDGGVTLDELAAHVELLARAASVPLAVDIEDGFGPAPEDAAGAVARVAEAGAVGGSIEDWDSRDRRIYELGHAVERVAAAVEAARQLDVPFTFTARAENAIRGNPDLEDTIARLQAFEAAGADVLFAPGLTRIEDVRAVLAEVSRPLNVLWRPGLALPELADAGVRRVSVGGALTWVAARALEDAAGRILADGDFGALERPPDLDRWLGPA